MARQEPDVHELLRQVRLLLADWLEKSKEAHAPVARILRLLDGIEEGFARQPSRRGAERGRGTVTYTVEKTGSGEVLTEGGAARKSPPFRVPKHVYDLVADVISSSHEALKFEDIFEKTNQRADISPGDYQVRTCLRFWLSRNPPLITRTRSTYQPRSQSSFKAEASSAWRSLASEQLRR